MPSSYNCLLLSSSLFFSFSLPLLLSFPSYFQNLWIKGNLIHTTWSSFHTRGQRRSWSWYRTIIHRTPPVHFPFIFHWIEAEKKEWLSLNHELTHNVILASRNKIFLSNLFSSHIFFFWTSTTRFSQVYRQRFVCQSHTREIDGWKLFSSKTFFNVRQGGWRVGRRHDLFDVWKDDLSVFLFRETSLTLLFIFCLITGWVKEPQLHFLTFPSLINSSWLDLSCLVSIRPLPLSLHPSLPFTVQTCWMNSMVWSK